MSEVTRILSAIEQGDPTAAGELLPLVYDELRKLAAHRLAQEKPGQTLEPTALVHEAYLRLVGEGTGQHWNGRGHFFAAAAEAGQAALLRRPVAGGGRLPGHLAGHGQAALGRRPRLAVRRPVRPRRDRPGVIVPVP
jgi:hypothetical protein